METITKQQTVFVKQDTGSIARAYDEKHGSSSGLSCARTLGFQGNQVQGLVGPAVVTFFVLSH